MIAKLTCPGCQTLGKFSVEGGQYKGPYRCWKCRALYAIEMVNDEVVSWKPMVEKELEELKAKQEAEKRGHAGAVNLSPSPQSPTSTPQTPFAWPKEPDKVVSENKQQESPKQTFAWPRVPSNEPKNTASTASPSITSEANYILPGEKSSRMNKGIILFQTMTTLVEAEKLLSNEGCAITRITKPFDMISGCAIALRFPWSQQETVKSLLDKASVQTQGILQLSS